MIEEHKFKTLNELFDKYISDTVEDSYQQRVLIFLKEKYNFDLEQQQQCETGEIDSFKQEVLSAAKGFYSPFSGSDNGPHGMPKDLPVRIKVTTHTGEHVSVAKYIGEDQNGTEAYKDHYMREDFFGLPSPIKNIDGWVLLPNETIIKFFFDLVEKSKSTETTEAK